ncbi:MAG: hypothetical protein ACXWT1_14325 [Methylobacter sp.]
MAMVGQRERTTQNRVVKLFRDQLGYTYYGDWQDRADAMNTRGKQSLYDTWIKMKSW